jgi:hypothetical protein
MPVLALPASVLLLLIGRDSPNPFACNRSRGTPASTRNFITAGLGYRSRWHSSPSLTLQAVRRYSKTSISDDPVGGATQLKRKQIPPSWGTRVCSTAPRPLDGRTTGGVLRAPQPEAPIIKFHPRRDARVNLQIEKHRPQRTPCGRIGGPRSGRAPASSIDRDERRVARRPNLSRWW